MDVEDRQAVDVTRSNAEKIKPGLEQYEDLQDAKVDGESRHVPTSADPADESEKKKRNVRKETLMEFVQVPVQQPKKKDGTSYESHKICMLGLRSWFFIFFYCLLFTH